MGWALSTGLQALFKGHLTMYCPALQPFIDFTQFHSDWFWSPTQYFKGVEETLMTDCLSVRLKLFWPVYIFFLTNRLRIIMYIYHVLINALSAHMMQINLNMIFYTHVEHSPTKTVYIKYYTKQKQRTTNTQTHTMTVADCNIVFDKGCSLLLSRLTML